MPSGCTMSRVTYLGYEGVYATPGSNMDNSTYGTVIYEVKPGAAEQRVVGPEIAKVLQRYEFTPCRRAEQNY
jgi:hypothetical protein